MRRATMGTDELQLQATTATPAVAGFSLAIEQPGFPAWALSWINWPLSFLDTLLMAHNLTLPTLVALISALSTTLSPLAYAVIDLELSLSTPQVSAPLITSFAALWLALTIRDVRQLAELQATANPDKDTTELALAVFQRGTLIQGSVQGVVTGALVLGALAGGSKLLLGIESSNVLTTGLMLGLLGLLILAETPLANIFLPSALREPWNTKEGRRKAEAAMAFFNDSPWSHGARATWALPQYRQVLLYDLACRANALNQVRQALKLGGTPSQAWQRKQRLSLW